MPAAVNLIEELEREIGISIKQRDYTELNHLLANGFSLDEKGKIIGLNLDGRLKPGISLNFLLNFKHLRVLNLNSTGINDISCLQELTQLCTLGLVHNRINVLPEEIVDLGMNIDLDSKYINGAGLFLYGNPLEKPPQEIVRQGYDIIKNWYRNHSPYQLKHRK